MILPTRFLSLLSVLVLAFGELLILPGKSQEPGADLENHASVKVVKEYLKHMLEQNWEESGKLVEPKSLNELRDDYVRRVKKTASLDDEKLVLSKFNVKDLEDIQKMSGITFYATYHKLLKDRTPVDPIVLKKVRDSMKMRILSVAKDTDTLVHVVIRTKHNNDKVVVESMEVISLVKVGDRWMVGLNEQTPKISPIKEAPPAATTAPAPAQLTTPEPGPKAKSKKK